MTAKSMFPLGQVVATPGALEALAEAGMEGRELLDRHAACDWGNVPKEDARENERGLRQGFRLMSSYPLPTGKVVWVITEWDRSATTLLLPGDY